jgi:hypothetical protein
MKTRLHLLIATTPKRAPAPARRFALALVVFSLLLLGAPLNWLR